MNYRTRIFVDFWNFQINWNERNHNQQVNWKIFPRELVSNSSKLLTEADIINDFSFEEIRVYASVDKNNPKDKKLKNWFNEFLERQPSYQVYIRERKTKKKIVHCVNCDQDFDKCPNCKEQLKVSVEKGVDAAIITDLFSLYLEDAYDIGILVSSDSDFIPSVKRLQEKGIKIINATWKGHGFDLAKACWASFYLDEIVASITRET